jgi:CubicO group peptidase (beta-lactamase class C family)
MTSRSGQGCPTSTTIELRRCYPRARGRESVGAALGADTIAGKVLFIGPQLGIDGVALTMNDPAFWRSQTPGIGFIGDARSLATLYGTLAFDASDDGRRLARSATIADHTEVRFEGPDALTDIPLRIGTGFQLPIAAAPFSHGRRAFGHSGLSGAIGFADPDAGLGFGYVTNAMRGATGLDRRAATLVDAAYRCLAGAGPRTAPI